MKLFSLSQILTAILLFPTNASLAYEREYDRPLKPVCSAIVSGEVSQQTVSEGPGLVSNFLNRVNKKPWEVTPLEREDLPDSTIKDLKINNFVAHLMERQLFENDRLSTRLNYELSHPLSNIKEIQDRQEMVKIWRDHPKAKEAFENLKLAFKELDRFSLAVYGDDQAEFRMKSVQSYHSFVWFLDALRIDKSYSSFRRYHDLPTNTMGLTLYFASDNELKLFGFSKSDYEEFANMERAIDEFLSVLKDLDHPEFQRLAGVFEYFQNPQLLKAEQQKIKFWDHFFPEKKREKIYDNRERAAQTRAVSVLAGLFVINEIEFYDFIGNLPGSKGTLPELIDSPDPELSIISGHNPTLVLDSAVDSVANSITLNEDQSIEVLVGPNFRGKSKYKQMIGLNVLLARMGGVVYADSYRSTVLSVLTSFNSESGSKSNDSLFSGKGRSQERFLEQFYKKNRTTIYLVDEIYYGTTPDQQLAFAIEFMIDMHKAGVIGVVTGQDHNLQSFIEHEQTNGRLQRIRLVHNTTHYTVEVGSATEREKNAVEVLEEIGGAYTERGFTDRARQRLEQIQKLQEKMKWEN